MTYDLCLFVCMHKSFVFSIVIKRPSVQRSIATDWVERGGTDNVESLINILFSYYFTGLYFSFTDLVRSDTGKRRILSYRMLRTRGTFQHGSNILGPVSRRSQEVDVTLHPVSVCSVKSGARRKDSEPPVRTVPEIQR